MKSLFLFLTLSTLIFVKNGFSQVIEPPNSLRVTRYDFSPTVPGYASAPLTLTIKANSIFGGTITAAKTYPANNTTQQVHFSNSAIFSGPTFQISGMFPGNTSNWYTLPTTVGGETDVIATDPGMTYHSGGYGFSVTVKCVAARTYEIRPTRFECYIVPCPGGGGIPMSGSAMLQSQTEQPSIFPNPVTDRMNLSVYAAKDQSLDIVITDVLGRKVQNVQHNAKAGKNVLPIATDQLSAGNYFVNFILDNQSTVLKCSKQ